MTVILWTAIALVVLFFVSAAAASLSSAPWVPTRGRDVQRIARLLELAPGKRLVELGSGDGRVLIALAETTGATVVGYELSLLPYLVAQVRRWKSPARRRITLRYGDFFRAPLRDADAVYCFLVPQSMNRLETKSVHELRPGVPFLSYAFGIPGRPADRVDKPDARSISLHLYGSLGASRSIDAEHRSLVH